MAERLTRNNKFSIYNQDNLDTMYDKLAEIEDIMEEYNIKTISQLKARLSGEDKSHKSAIGYMKDRDTWKRACELACRHIAEVEWLSCPETDDISESENEIKTLTKQSLNYFCQQAKQVTGKLPAN